MFRDQGEEREDAAFALVIGLHDEGQILQGDHEHERPEDERENAVEIGLRRGVASGGVKTFLQRIERTGSDVPEDDA